MRSWREVASPLLTSSPRVIIPSLALAAHKMLPYFPEFRHPIPLSTRYLDYTLPIPHTS